MFGIFRRKALDMRMKGDMGIEIGQTVNRCFDLWFIKLGVTEKYLPLQVGNLDAVKITNADTTYAGGCEVL